jgi:sugar lactone lactonase YvrE
MQIAALDVPKSLVGESPVWDADAQLLYWIDILGKAVWRYDPADGSTRQWHLPETAGSMTLRASGGVILALPDGVHSLDFETGALKLIAASNALTPDTQLADGKVDRRGRFIVGSADRAMKEPIGKIFVLEPGAGELRVIDDDIILANGPCWSPDDRIFYHADSMRNAIFAYDYDIEAGQVSGRRVFASFAGFDGFPDGATVDEEGFVWSAMCEGGKIIRFAPDGSVDRLIDFPVKLPGSVMFGGAQLDRLFVPSLNPSFLGRTPDPLDGALFVIDGLGARGLPEPKFAG